MTDFKRVQEIVDLYFAPWGAAKAARWEALTNDARFDAETAMRLIQAALQDDDKPLP